MNHKWRNRVFKKYRFLDTGTNSSSRVPVERLQKTRSNFSRSVMVSVAVSSLESMELVFVEPGVKVDGAFYRNALLTQHLLPAINWMSGGHFIFQQDSAPTHWAQETIALLSGETPDFIPPWLWPPNSPDLNPVERTGAADVSHMNSRRLSPQDTSGWEWKKFDQKTI